METRKKRRRINRDDAKRKLTPDTSDTALGILEQLAKYRYLTPRLMAMLLGKNNKQHISWCVRPLIAKHYIAPYRPEYGIELPNTWDDFYYLDEKGEQYLIDRGRKPYEITRLYRKETGVSVPNFVHSFAICNYLASLEVGLRPTSMISWQEIMARLPKPQYKLPFDIKHTFKTGTERFAGKLAPDGLFGIPRENNKPAFFALEIENGQPIERDTLKAGSTMKKVLAYRDITKNHQHTKLYGLPNMKTIFVTFSEQRMQHMVDMTLRVLGPTDQFLFTHYDFRRPSPLENPATRLYHRAGMEPTTLI